jgi:hypothetical protein
MVEHVQKLENIFKRLEQANFKIQPEKCVYGTDKVEYLGHVVTRDGIKPYPRKVQAIEQYPVPKTVRDVRAFIGLAGYQWYSTFFVRVAPDIISLQLCTPKVVGT